MASVLRAPHNDGGILCVPDRDHIPNLLHANATQLSASTVDILGTPLTALRHQTRREVLALAQAYHHNAGEPPPMWNHTPWIVAGHQPELFHPGVWVKNFALAHWAKRFHATALNLIIDNDIVKSTSLRVPGHHRFETIAFDKRPAGVPYEEASVQDETLFDSVPARVRDHTGTWPFTPLVDVFWRNVRQQRERTGNLGERFAAARRALERAWGYEPCEVPLSHVCATRSFAHFAAYVLEHAESMRHAYNDAVHAYRARHALRSANHPVPDLARHGDWLELPLWVWSSAQPRRRHVLMRRLPHVLELRADSDVFARLTGSIPDRIDQWQALAHAGYKIRPRALMTTLWARLFLGDLFVHGIGGAKYDEVTDDLIRRLFDIEPPGIAALSATLWLPLPRYPDADAEGRRLRLLERDLRFNPQRHTANHSDLADQKAAWIQMQPETHAGRVERFHRLQDITEALRPAVAEQARVVAERIAHFDGLSRLHRMHTWREYAFCLYPQDTLRTFYSCHFAP
jgi:hypothetical protein